ncbi:MAG TPA: hypothetical protein VFC84_20450 [Desulfosporosinus sp.]|nr:hypothetical protein [Desulfosporosinus sp.]
MNKKRMLTLAGTLVLAGAVVAAGVYGPSSWKVFRQQSAISESVVLQSPPVDSIETPADPNATAVPGTTETIKATTAPSTTVTPPTTEDTSSKSKYRDPDNKLIDLAPSVTTYFGEGALSDDAKSLAFGAAWNIHQYVDGLLYGPAAGPQMNEQDIKKYIAFHQTLWNKQLKNESNAAKAATFTEYLNVLMNSGMDALDSKDKTRIEQFHQSIHDLDTHIMRNDLSSKIYGATPFATKRN